MFYSNPSEAMQAIRDSLENVTGIDSTMLGPKTGFLDFAYSGVNPTGVRQKMVQNENDNSYRAVQLTYFERDFGAGVNEVPATWDCDPTTQKPLKTLTVQPGLAVMEKFSIEEAYMREVVQETGNIDFIRDKYFKEKMRVLREKVDLKLFTKAGANMGANPAAGAITVGGPGEAGTYQPIDFFDSTGKTNPLVFDTLRNQMEDNFLSATPVAIGLGLMRHYFNTLRIQEINADGVDYRALMNDLGFGFVKDQQTAAALGAANRFLVVAPGAVQPYHYNVNKGQYVVRVSDTEGKGTMPDPVYPQLQWDFDYAYARCAGPDTTQGVYTFRIWLYFDLFVVPVAILNASDPIYGQNGIYGYVAQQAA